MTWYKIHKTYRGGGSPIDYIEVPKGTKKDEVKEIAEAWAERRSGGGEAGWTVYWKRVNKPSQKWLSQEITLLHRKIDNCMHQVQLAEDEIKKLAELFKK